MIRFVLDTNIVIEYLRNKDVHFINTKARYIVSTVTYAEVLRYRGLSNDEVKQIQEFFSICDLIPVDKIIADRSAEIGRTRKMQLPDLFIAATALETHAPLVTKDKRGFSKIKGLKILTALSA